MLMTLNSLQKKTKKRQSLQNNLDLSTSNTYTTYMMKTASELKNEAIELTNKMGKIEVFGYCLGNPICLDNEGTFKTICLDIKDKSAIKNAFLEMFKNENVSQEDAKDLHVSFHEVNGKKEFVCYSIVSSLDLELTSISPENYPLD